MPDTDQHPALTFVMVEHHLLKIIRNHRPDVHTLNRVDAAVMAGEGTAEMAASASIFAAPEPAITKIGGAILAAHGADMIASGWHAWNTGNAAQTMTSRAAQATAMMAHASPVVASITGVAADGLLPAAVLHGATHYAASQAVRVVSADASHLQLNHGDIIDHFHHPVPGRWKEEKMRPIRICARPTGKALWICIITKHHLIIARQGATLWQSTSIRPRNTSKGDLIRKNALLSPSSRRKKLPSTLFFMHSKRILRRLIAGLKNLHWAIPKDL